MYQIHNIYIVCADVTVEFTMATYIYTISLSDDSDSVGIPVKVTTFGFLTRNVTVSLQCSRSGPVSMHSINGTSTPQNLTIPISTDVNHKVSVVTLTMTTEDPLVELKGNLTAAVITHTVDSSGMLLSCSYRTCM